MSCSIQMPFVRSENGTSWYVSVYGEVYCDWKYVRRLGIANKIGTGSLVDSMNYLAKNIGFPFAVIQSPDNSMRITNKIIVNNEEEMLIAVLSIQ